MKKFALALSVFSCTLFFSQKSQNYLQIGYASICCGTPSVKPVMNFVLEFQKKNKIRAFEVLKQSGLGREGEFNLYIGTDHLSKTQKASFVKGLQAAVDTQNSHRNTGSDGIVNFEKASSVTKTDLANAKNLTIYKK